MKDRVVYVYNHFRDHGLSSAITLVFTKLKMIKTRTEQMNCNDIKRIVEAKFSDCVPLSVYTLPKHAEIQRITLVTDSINSGSFFGGVGTAIIFAALLAQARNARLRIVTRTEQGQPENVGLLLAAQHITLSHEIEFAFSPPLIASRELDIFEDELFITTSWWTTAATMASVRHDSIIYLLQEDERMFYPYGDQHLRCSDTLKSNDIKYIVNTKLLFNYFVEQGFDNIAKNGSYFEPAFSRDVFKRQSSIPADKFKLMFYARPHNPRNLFYLGLEILDEAIMRGIVDLKKWDIVLIGQNIPKIIFNGDYVPINRENMSWTEYAALIGEMDLGLCLMYTPHPSYPPLDLVAGGAVAVTNRFANKQDMSCYSKNIILGDLNKEAMLKALQAGIALSMDQSNRQENARTSPLASNWIDALSEVVKQHARGSR